jgi:CCR4-NOT transcription complex subunit 2
MLVISPYAVAPSVGAEPVYQLPACYSLPQSPSPLVDRMSQLSDDTLFYMFYAHPKDMLQEMAAQELYNRGWRFHKEQRVWLTIDPKAEVLTKGPGYERAVYIIFDYHNWTRTRKEFFLYYDQLEERGKQ